MKSVNLLSTSLNLTSMLLATTSGYAQDQKPVTSFKLVPGASLVVSVNWPKAPAIGRERLVLSINRNSRVPKILNDYKSSVSINNEEEALNFVRLRTSYTTWYLWDNPQREVEVVETSRVGSIPNFGLKQRLPPSRRLSGLFGVLSSQAYMRGGFTPPKVQRVHHGFEVTRWIYISDYAVEPPKSSVQQLREFVGIDGEYKRTILIKMTPPKLPDTVWDIFGLL